MKKIDLNKVCFIHYNSDSFLVEESIKYINSLDIPNNIEIEIHSFQEVSNIGEAYKAALNVSKARYFVFLNSEAFIINRSFLFETINAFNESKDLAVLGVLGAKVNFHLNDVFFDSSSMYGKIYEKHTGKIDLLEFTPFYNQIESVNMISSALMITKNDITIEEDLNSIIFNMDLVNCKPFINKGLSVGVFKQEKPWILYDNNLYKYKGENDFTVSNEKLPLVSVLIPTYNRPDYFEVALKSVLDQTYPNIEIIIGDDSTNNDTRDLIKKYLMKHGNISYIKNNKNLGQYENDLMLFKETKGEYINFLMDDDYFHPEKISRMMEYFVNDKDEEIKLVTSHRKMVGPNYEPYEDKDVTAKIYNEDTIVDGLSFGSFVLKHNFNCIGEPTTVLFRKKDLTVPFGTFDGRKYDCNVDIATWLNLLSQGKAVYISDTLSYFRIHDDQQQNKIEMRIKGLLDYAHSILVGRKKGFLSELNDYTKALTYYLELSSKTMNEITKMGYETSTQTLVKQHEIIEKELMNIGNKQNNHDDNSSLEHQSDSLPLVSILIPTYNQTHYLKLALESAINQTYPNIEIIIGDDSTNDEVEKFLKPYLENNKNIFYFRNLKRENYGTSNVQNLLTRSKGEYINFLYHDDIFHEKKIEKMVKSFKENENISLVTSHRQLIDENGKFLPDSVATKSKFNQDSLISGRELSLLCIEDITNYIGEPTTVMFKKCLIEDNVGYFNKNLYINIFDLGTWLSLLLKGGAVYISESLSFVRQHGLQNSKDNNIHLLGIIEWKKIIDDCYTLNLIDNRTSYRKLLLKWFYTFNYSINNISTNTVNNTYKLMLKESIISTINLLFENDIFDYECVMCGMQVENFLPYMVDIPHSIDEFEIIGSDTDNFSCPNCYSHDRERHLALYLSKLDLWDVIKNSKILHVAPEAKLQNFIEGLTPIEYVRGDLYPTDKNQIKIDITNLQFENEYFNFVICNHVLEHVEEDIKAMSELFRVLKKGGYAILQTPYSPLIKKSYEDPKINTEKGRLDNFGQVDHVRIFGLDLFERLKNVGFHLNLIKNKDLFSIQECRKYGVNYKEDLILLRK